MRFTVRKSRDKSPKEVVVNFKTQPQYQYPSMQKKVLMIHEDDYKHHDSDKHQI